MTGQMLNNGLSLVVFVFEAAEQNNFLTNKIKK